MTIFKIQYLKEDGTLISTQEYEKASDFLLELNDLTTVQESENTFRTCFVNKDLLSLAGSDDLLVELDANVFKKYPAKCVSARLAHEEQAGIHATLEQNMVRLR